MEDVTEDVVDSEVTLTVDTRAESQIPMEFLQLGQATDLLHSETGVRVQHVNIDSDERPPRFQISGVVTDR